MTDSVYSQMDFMYWNNCLIRLSMDIVLPLYEDLGLQLSDKAKFQYLLKERIKLNLRKDEEYPYPWIENKILNELEIDFKNELTSEDFTNFICFATTIYDTKCFSWLEWHNWNDAFTKMLYPVKYYKQQFVDSESNELRLKLLNIYDTVSLTSAKIDLIDSIHINLTEWDQMIFNITGFDILSDYNNPYVELRITAGMNEFQLFWENYVLKLSETELDQVYKICNDINLSNNTEDRLEDYKKNDGTVVKMLIPGLKYGNLKKCKSMRRCVAS